MPDVTPELAKGGINLAVTLVVLMAGRVPCIGLNWRIHLPRRSESVEH
jgi:hypothetical protein